VYEMLRGLNIRNRLISTLLLYILHELVAHCVSDIRGEGGLELPRRWFGFVVDVNANVGVLPACGDDEDMEE